MQAASRSLGGIEDDSILGLCMIPQILLCLWYEHPFDMYDRALALRVVDMETPPLSVP